MREQRLHLTRVYCFASVHAALHRFLAKSCRAKSSRAPRYLSERGHPLGVAPERKPADLRSLFHLPSHPIVDAYPRAPPAATATRARPCSAALDDAPDRVHRRAIAAAASAHRRPLVPGGCATKRTTPHTHSARPGAALLRPRPPLSVARVFIARPRCCKPRSCVPLPPPARPRQQCTSRRSRHLLPEHPSALFVSGHFGL